MVNPCSSLACVARSIVSLRVTVWGAALVALGVSGAYLGSQPRKPSIGARSRHGFAPLPAALPTSLSNAAAGRALVLAASERDPDQASPCRSPAAATDSPTAAAPRAGAPGPSSEVAPHPPSPFRFVTAENALPNNVFRVDRKRRVVSRQVHHIGSAAVRVLHVGLPNFIVPGDLNESLGPGNNVRVAGVYAYCDGQDAGHPVTFNGGLELKLEDGGPVRWSDPITPATLSLPGAIFTAGTKLVVTVALDLVEGQRYVNKLYSHFGSTAEPNAGTVRVNPDSSRVTNIGGVGPLVWTGSEVTTASMPAILVGGFFADGDAAVFGAIGDSILFGVGGNVRTADGLALGAFQLALWPSNAATGTPRAGCVFARPAGLAEVWSSTRLYANTQPLLRMCNRFVEQYGTNRIGTSNSLGLAVFAYSESRALWALLRSAQVSGFTVRIARTSLLPRTTGRWSSLAEQTPAPGWGLGGVASAFDALVLADQGQPSAFHDYIDWSVSVRGNPSPQHSDRCKWMPLTSEDGLHPGDSGYDGMALPLRVWMERQMTGR